MSYQVLARKWRPRSFNDMVGQEPILRMLGNALQQNRIHHAYLFTGTRGVGKTTLARILAKCLNCETGVTPSPCGTCATCLSIDAGQFLDLFEIDAASRTKVEDTRELLDNVLYQPTQGRYKIYLIDEVHMLSNHSFNALLKTLEEPPDYVKFLLATTDPKRLPATILSRCLQFHLKRIPVEQIAERLEFICSTEKIIYDIQGLKKLAKAADGSLRDAMSLLDQAIAYGHGAVHLDEVNAMLGSMNQDDLFPLLNALADRDAKTVFTIVHELAEHAPDFQQVLEEIITIFHQLAIAQIIPDAASIDTITSLAQRFTPEDLQLYYQIALIGRRDLSFSTTPQQGFEMTLLRMLAFIPAQSQVTTAQTEAPVKTKIKTQPIPPSISQPQKEISPPSSKQSEHNALPSALDWRNLLPQLGLSGMAYALAANCMLEKITDHKIELMLSENHQPMLNPKLKDRIADALSQHFKHPIHLEITITSTELVTPTKQHQQEQEKSLAHATQTLLENPQIKQFIELYDATVDVSLT